VTNFAAARGRTKYGRVSRVTHRLVAALDLILISLGRAIDGAPMPVAGLANAAPAGHAVSLFGILYTPPLMTEHDRVSQAVLAAHLVVQYLL
jgi:cytochrome b561